MARNHTLSWPLALLVSFLLLEAVVQGRLMNRDVNMGHEIHRINRGKAGSHTLTASYGDGYGYGSGGSAGGYEKGGGEGGGAGAGAGFGQGGGNSQGGGSGYGGGNGYGSGSGSGYGGGGKGGHYKATSSLPASEYMS